MSDATRATDPSSRTGSKLLLIVVGLVVLLGAGGAGAFFQLKPSDARAGSQETAKRAEAIYVALDPSFVVNFESNGMVRFLQVTVQAMAHDPVTAGLIKKHDPVIRNGLLMLFSGQSHDTLRTAEGKEKLRQAALAEVRKVVTAQGGQGAEVKNLYFTSFVMQ
jgi:flagellar protein FliL